MTGAQALASQTVYFERRVNANVFPVLPGEHLVIDDKDAAIGTLLGSCVAACIRDRRTGIGGLNHFLLPGKESNQSARYGVYAMEVLINEILSRGATKPDLEAKVFGGAAVIERSKGGNIGASNADFVKTYLQNEGIRVLSEDLGGSRGRRLYYFPGGGHARVQYMNNAESRDAALTEQRLDKQLTTKPRSGTVELF